MMDRLGISLEKREILSENKEQRTFLCAMTFRLVTLI